MLKNEESSGRGAAVAAGGSRKLRILVVDDNHDAAGSLALWVETLGHEALLAHDGRQALETALRTRPDVVLLDIATPGMSGDEVARRLRASAQLRQSTLVALSGLGGCRRSSELAPSGFRRHLVKPVELATFEEVLSASVARRPD
jgi:CheY-like chemotaxis protein